MSTDVSLPFILSASQGQDAKAFMPEKFHPESDMPRPVLWHGSSAVLKKRATKVIEREFEHVGYFPYKKMGSRLYFLAVLEGNKIKCCLRCILDGEWDDDDEDEEDEFCYHRLVIEYICTTKDRQGRGYASFLVEKILEYGRSQGANNYVLALESAFGYWERKGFVHSNDDNDAGIQDRLCLFDCDHLMKLPSNRPEDPELDESSSDESESESESESSSSSSSSYSSEEDQPQRRRARTKKNANVKRRSRRR